jgi:two-component system, NtrC family, nitrogen regulation response regulator NtrX
MTKFPPVENPSIAQHPEHAEGPPIAEAFFGASAAICHVMELVTAAAAADINVLVSGEPGTGREMIARAIHARSDHAHAPFVAVDCSEYPPHDLETEVFGLPVAASPGRKVERRALERVRRTGRLYKAIGGTLFLEHVMELPARAQARLSRVLRDREAVVQDEGEHVQVDVRAITAADSRFDTAVADGRIEADLHKRLSAFRIEVPPLRHRKDDIPPLAVHLVNSICHRAHVPCKILSQPAQILLAALPWRGNAPELRSLLEGLVMRVPGETIGLEDVLANVQLDGRAGRFVAGGSLREARERFEREYIAAVLEQYRGRIPDAARTLGIQRTNLYRKLKRLDLRPGRIGDE